MNAAFTLHGAWRRDGLRAVLAIALLLALPAAAPVDDRTVPEYQLKAAILAQFIHYTTWPEDVFESPDAPLVVAVVGQDPFGKYIDEALATRDHDGRQIVVRRFAEPEDIGPCHFLFVSRSLADRTDEVFIHTDEESIFTVSDISGFAEMGGTSRMFLANGRIKFEVNMDAARRSRLTLASGLLKLAKIIEDTDG